MASPIIQVQHVHGPASIDVRRIVGTVTAKRVEQSSGPAFRVAWDEPSGSIALPFDDAEKAAQTLAQIHNARTEFAKHCV